MILHFKRLNQINITDKAVNNHPRSRQMTIRLIRRIAQLPANSRERSNQRILIDSNKIPSRRLIIVPNRPPAIMRTKRPIKKPLLNITRIKPLLSTKRLLIIMTKSLLTMRAKMLLTIKLTFRHGSDLKVNFKIIKANSKIKISGSHPQHSTEGASPKISISITPTRLWPVVLRRCRSIRG